MRTHHFDEPVIVRYRTGSSWQRALALGVRRSDDDSYDVLIMEVDEAEQSLAWVPRARVRADDAAAS